MRRLASGRGTGWLAVAALGAALLPSCDGPIVARTPESLYALAQEQIANANFSPALDTLAKIARESPESEWAVPARVLRLALLGGLARAYKEIAESYLAGHREAGEAAHAPRMRSVAMDYFGRARGRSLDLVEALEEMASQSFPETVQITYAVPEGLGAARPVLQRVREGTWLADEELAGIERQEVRRGLAAMLARLSGAVGDLNEAAGARGPEWRIDSARFYLGTAREMVETSSVFRPEALGDRRLFRLFHERAARLAAQAAQLAQARGEAGLQERCERLRRQAQQVLKSL